MHGAKTRESERARAGANSHMKMPAGGRNDDFVIVASAGYAPRIGAACSTFGAHSIFFEPYAV
jgi:hypothetical protein